MATYKVIQDIEAEDKLLGPLSLRQFIYAIIMLAIGFIAFTLAQINLLLGVPLLLPMGLFGLLAAPFGRDQSSEVWLLAKIRFAFKPRRRIWDQTGIKDYVTITVPKKIERHLTDGLDQTQVKSRLRALAETLDSRGWAIKNVSANTYAVPGFVTSYAGVAQQDNSDRLVAASTLPAAVGIASDVTIDDDILDERNNPTAQKLDSLITQSEQARRQSLIQTMQAPQQPQPQPTQPQPVATTSSPYPYAQTTPVAVQQSGPTTADEQQLLNKLHHDKEATQAANSHIKRIPTSQEIAAEQANAQKAQAAKAQQTIKAEELKRLATNDDLNIATIARQAKKDESETFGDDEVVISLH